MQLILFNKSSDQLVTKSDRIFSTLRNNELRQLILSNGTVCILPRSVYQSDEEFFASCGFSNCGIKRPEVELYRSLKLNRKKFTMPRRIIIPEMTPGAIKRSLNPFLQKRYRHSDPACLIVVPDLIYPEILTINEPDPCGARDPVVRHSAKPLDILLADAEKHVSYQELCHSFLGNSPDARLIRAFILRAAQTSSPVLILGETGTGKDMIARQIFYHSLSHTRDFTVVNCSAFPDTLFEAELFGYKRGAFTDARDNRDGLLVATNNGTLFLDEIGDLSLVNQAKLLHAIETQRVRPVGSTKSIEVDVRIIAATNRNIDAMVLHGSFREDLHYRLNTFRIFSSPLRNHPEDIPMIASAIWSKLNPGNTLSDKFLSYLQDYPWPGNVRELKTMLNGITDLFGNVSPTPEHIITIRKIRNDALLQAKNTEGQEVQRILKMQSMVRINQVTTIISEIRNAVQSFFRHQPERPDQTKETGKLKSFLENKTGNLDELCREPVYFQDIQLFTDLTRYRDILTETTACMTTKPEALRTVWISTLKELDYAIQTRAISLIWGKANA